MRKRFTDSDKWEDKWFRRLPPDQKLAYLYLLDRCDGAGTIELDTELAEFQMGTATDWEGLIKGSEGRLTVLHCGRIWVRKFIEFQNGTLSADCNAHRPILTLIEKFSLPVEMPTKGSGRVEEPLAKGPSKSNSKGKSKEKGECEGEDWEVPAELDSPKVRELLADFAAMRRRIGKPIKSRANTSKILPRFDSPDHLCYALETCIANEYQGLKPDYRPRTARKTDSGPPAPKMDETTRREMERARALRAARAAAS